MNFKKMQGIIQIILDEYDYQKLLTLIVQEYAKTEGSPLQAAAQGLIEDVIRPEDTREVLRRLVEMLASKRVSTLPKKHSNIQL